MKYILFLLLVSGAVCAHGQVFSGLTANNALILRYTDTTGVVPVIGTNSTAFIFRSADSLVYWWTNVRKTWTALRVAALDLKASATLDFPSTASQTSSDLTITLTGAALGDLVILGVPNAAVSANSDYTAWVSATNTVSVRFNNYQVITAIDPASAVFKVAIIK